MCSAFTHAARPIASALSIFSIEQSINASGKNKSINDLTIKKFHEHVQEKRRNEYDKRNFLKISSSHGPWKWPKHNNLPEKNIALHLSSCTQ